MAKKYRVAALPGRTFDSREDAQTEIDRQQAKQGIARFNSATPLRRMASQAGADAWANAPKKDLQRISDGQVFNDLYGEGGVGDLRMARRMGLSGNPSPEAKAFVGNLKNEATLQDRKDKIGGGSVWELQGDVGGEDLSKANASLLEQYTKAGMLIEEEAKAMKIINKRRPYDVSEWLKGVMQQRGKAFAGIPGQVAQQGALLPGQVRKVVAEESAKLPFVESREEIKRKSKQLAESGKAVVNFEKVKNLMKNIWDRKKEQLGTTGAGLLVGGAKKVLGAARLPGGEKTATYEGQKTETAMSLNSVLTGQNRLIEGIFKRIIATLPDELDPKNYAIPKIDQSLRNSYGLVKAMRMNGLLDEEYLGKYEESLPDGTVGMSDEYEGQVARLSPAPLDEEEEREIREIINFVLGVDSPYRKPGAKNPVPKAGEHDYSTEYDF